MQCWSLLALYRFITKSVCIDKDGDMQIYKAVCKLHFLSHNYTCLDAETHLNTHIDTCARSMTGPVNDKNSKKKLSFTDCVALMGFSNSIIMSDHNVPVAIYSACITNSSHVHLNHDFWQTKLAKYLKNFWTHLSRYISCPPADVAWQSCAHLVWNKIILTTHSYFTNTSLCVGGFCEYTSFIHLAPEF